MITHCEYGYTSNLSLEAMDDDDVLVAWANGGQDLEPEHGWPLRLVVPKRYAWKSAKWLTGLEFVDKNKRGFWEVRGLPHARGALRRGAVLVPGGSPGRARALRPKGRQVLLSAAGSSDRDRWFGRPRRSSRARYRTEGIEPRRAPGRRSIVTGTLRDIGPPSGGGSTERSSRNRVTRSSTGMASIGRAGWIRALQSASSARRLPTPAMNDWSRRTALIRPRRVSRSRRNPARPTSRASGPSRARRPSTSSRPPASHTPPNFRMFR